MPSHDHTGSGTTGNENQTHTHSQIAQTFNGSYAGASFTGPSGAGSQTGTESQSHTHFYSFTTDSSGNDQGHNTVQLSIVGTFYRKL